MEYLVDTNILVYETVLDSIYHDEVAANLERLGRVYVPTLTLIELAIVLHRLRLNNELIIERIREIMTEDRYTLVDISAEDLENALSTLEKEGKGVSTLNDKIILSVAKRLRLGVYTYDKKLKKQCMQNNISTL